MKPGQDSSILLCGVELVHEAPYFSALGHSQIAGQFLCNGKLHLDTAYPLSTPTFQGFCIALSLISKAWKASIPAQGNGWFQAAATMSRYPSNVTQMFSNRKLLKCGRAQSVRGSKGTWSEHSEESATGRGSERQPANHQKQETDQASRVWGCHVGWTKCSDVLSGEAPGGAYRQ